MSRCHKCLNKGVVVLHFVLLVVGWYVINVTVSRRVASLEMLLAWAQLANIMGDINLNWPDKVSKMFGMANILDFDVNILEPTCLLPWGYTEKFMTQLCLPFLMTLMGCSGYFASIGAYYMRCKKWLKPDGKRHEVLSWLVHIPETRKECKEKLDHTIATYLASVDVTYLTIAKYCFDVFKCEDIAGKRVLRVDPEEICHGGKYDFMRAISVLAIAFYVVGHLGYLCWTLYYLRVNKAFSNSVNLKRFGFIYEQFEADYWYTPVIVMVRKLLFVLTVIYVNNPAFQVGILAIIINASLIIHIYSTPYVDTYLDVMFNFLLFTLMFEAFGGLMFYSENLPETNRDILEWIVLATVLVLVLVFSVFFSLEVYRKYQRRFIKKVSRPISGNDRQPGMENLKLFLAEIRMFLDFNSFPSLLSRCIVRPEKKGADVEVNDSLDLQLVFSALKKKPKLKEDWSTVTKMLTNYYMSVEEETDTSYLSLDPEAKFWRRLVNRFPALVDFLAVMDDESRQKFIDVMAIFRNNLYGVNKIQKLPVKSALNWRDYGMMARWLAYASEEDRKFFLSFLVDLFQTVGYNDRAANIQENRLKYGGEQFLEVSITANNEMHQERSRNQQLLALNSAVSSEATKGEFEICRFPKVSLDVTEASGKLG